LENCNFRLLPPFVVLGTLLADSGREPESIKSVKQ